MNVLQRFTANIEVMLHELFEKSAHKDPIALLNQYVRQAEKETAEVGQLVNRQLELKHKLTTEVQQVKEKLAKRERQLKLAIAAEQQDLIDFAQQQVASYKGRLAVLIESEQEAMDEYLRLEQQFEQMKHRLEDMKVRQLQLMSKENVAHAQHRMQEISVKQPDMYANSFASAVEYLEQVAHTVDKQYEAITLERRLAALESKE